VEIRREDPLSITKRTKSIKVPILLLFGNKEPFIPVKFLSGLSDLKKEVIKPFYNDLKAEGNPPVVKVYPDASHFIHTDVADEFSRDVVDFTIKGYISTPSNVDSF
jgi:pimeloyl-ACP methyl ester carboxylesterase